MSSREEDAEFRRENPNERLPLLAGGSSSSSSSRSDGCRGESDGYNGDVTGTRIQTSEVPDITLFSRISSCFHDFASLEWTPKKVGLVLLCVSLLVLAVVSFQGRGEEGFSSVPLLSSSNPSLPEYSRLGHAHHHDKEHKSHKSHHGHHHHHHHGQVEEENSSHIPTTTPTTAPTTTPTTTPTSTQTTTPTSTPTTTTPTSTPTTTENKKNECTDFSGHAYPKVREDLPSFPSYQTYAKAGGPIEVTYDARSLKLNGTNVLFLGGSIHPARTTHSTYLHALDEAVRNGLNMITIYVFWSYHQPFPDMDIDWSLPGGTEEFIMEFEDTEGTDIVNEEENDMGAGCITDDNNNNYTEIVPSTWELANAVAEAGKRGLFVHMRIGPYVCAEYSYGGIPEWLPLQHPDIEMRRLNKPWQDSMADWVTLVTKYFSNHNLWAYQGGPMIMGQIENEIGDDTGDAMAEVIIESTPELQIYADWSGELAQTVEPNVLWTMCNGLTAPNAINTCNGNEECAVPWIESKGQTGRIQVDQPALWTEDEGGYQMWGDDPANPSDYFWKRPLKKTAHDGVRWFARGGSHLNYYMWWGSYNRGRQAGAGITNMYAADGMLCPSGQRNHKKFEHLKIFHDVIAEVADTLVGQPSAVNNAEPVEVLSDDGDLWITGTEQKAYIYNKVGNETKQVVFIENNADSSVVVRLANYTDEENGIALYPHSSVILVDGQVQFDSAQLSPKITSHHKTHIDDIGPSLAWYAWPEPIGASLHDHNTVIDTKPLEQTQVVVSKRVSTDFVWYETKFSINQDLQAVSLSFDTAQGSAFSAFVDGKFVGTAFDHNHNEQPISLTIDLGDVSQGEHTLAILSESLGYHNLIGRWSGGTTAKVKGLTGDVKLTATTDSGPFELSLVDGTHIWGSRAGLNINMLENTGRRLKKEEELKSEHPLSVITPPATWSLSLFETPSYDPYDQSLMLDITAGRGRIWLNGNDLGRFWNITRGSTSEYTQRYYLLPPDFMYADERLNELAIFNSMEGDLSSIRMVLVTDEKKHGSSYQIEDESTTTCTY